MKEKISKEMKTSIIGKNLIYYDKIDSTQVKARELAEESIENGTIVVANSQDNGIGTHDRKWHTGEGTNIAFTLIIYPKCNIDKLEHFTLDIARCMVDSIWDLYGYKLNIKEPNDLIYNGKKVGGILTQAISLGSKIKYILIGVGINVNETEFPDELKNIATSLKIEFKQDFSREEIICEFCKKIEIILIDKIK